MRELDLHGLKFADAMYLFVDTCNMMVAQGNAGGLKVIHGYGASGQGGLIRGEVRKLLKRNPHAATVVLGEDADNNPGYTLVYPKRRLPAGSERLWDSITEYCSEPRRDSDIVGRFIRRHGEPEIRKALAELENRGKIRSFASSGRRMYVVSLP
jgi:hypothetical protein